MNCKVRRAFCVFLSATILQFNVFRIASTCVISFGVDVLDGRTLEEPSPTDFSFDALLFHANLTYNNILDEQGNFQGDCIPYKNCPAWRSLPDNVPLNYIRLLRNVYCGQNGRTSLYCCPKQNIAPREAGGQGNNSTSTAKPSTMVVSDTTMFTVGASKGNLNLHVNRKLLPDAKQGNCGRDTNDKIINGVSAELGQYPWNVRLGYLDTTNPRLPMDFKCGGSLINNRYIVTAAHCFSQRNFMLTTVRLGEYDTRRDPDCSPRNGKQFCASPVIDVSVNMTNVISHPNFNLSNFRNDIALIRLPNPVTFSEWIQPICLPLTEVLRKPRDEVRVTVTGWGLTSLVTGASAEILQQIPLPVYDSEACHRHFTSLGRPIPISAQDQLCLGNGTGDSCRGDSGGPAMVIGDRQNPKFYLVGIVSFGPARCNSPGVYTLVSSYLKWVLDNIRS